MKSVLVTGVAGFIGWKVAEKLLERNIEVIGVDNINDYYDVKLKEYRLALLKKNNKFKFYKIDIENQTALNQIFKENSDVQAIINLAACAGVIYSLANPQIHMNTNVIGVLNLLENCRKYGIKKFVLSSTSSLYAGYSMPFSENLPVNLPISPYAASKKAAEMICYSYHYLYNLDITIFRYFTVYGPSSRPDMGIFRFIKWIDEGKNVEVFGDGSQSRDFTYVDDIADGTIKGLDEVGYEIINLGGNRPCEINYAIKLIEKFLGKEAGIKYKHSHKVDIMASWADISKAQKILNWKPMISLEKGLEKTVEWHK